MPLQDVSLVDVHARNVRDAVLRESLQLLLQPDLTCLFGHVRRFVLLSPARGLIYPRGRSCYCGRACVRARRRECARAPPPLSFSLVVLFGKNVFEVFFGRSEK